MTQPSLRNCELRIRVCDLVPLVRLSEAMAVPAPELVELAMQRTPVHLDMIALHVGPDKPPSVTSTRGEQL